MPGPVPKRSGERRRRNKSNQVETVEVSGTVEIPDPDPAWHPIAADWYRSLGESGQVRYMEPSDWQAARFVAEVMTRNLEAGKFSATLFASVWQAMTDLLTTEGARRRARMEIERGETEEGEDAELVALDGYRDALGG